MPSQVQDAVDVTLTILVLSASFIPELAMYFATLAGDLRLLSVTHVPKTPFGTMITVMVSAHV